MVIQIGAPSRFPDRTHIIDRTLLKNFSSLPLPLLKNRGQINRTLLKIFQSTLARKKSGRPYLQKDKQISLKAKPEKSILFVEKSGNSTRPCLKILQQTLIEFFSADPARKIFTGPCWKNFEHPLSPCLKWMNGKVARLSCEAAEDANYLYAVWI